MRVVEVLVLYLKKAYTDIVPTLNGNTFKKVGIGR